MSAVSSLEIVYVLTGLLLWVFAVLTWRDLSHPRRVGSACFWLGFGAIFALGSWLPDWLTGCLVLGLVALDGAGQVRGRTSGFVVSASESPSGRKIFLPVLVIPLATLAFAWLFQASGLKNSDGALIGLGLGSVAAFVLATRLTGCSLHLGLDAGRQLNETMGAVTMLPQLLASLGVVLAAAHVGDLVADGVRQLVPVNSPFWLALANCFGMAGLTVLTGNSFAAFPVIATGLLSPLIIEPLHANPALVAILTLTAGSSGTLLTPMAANFNTVPAALLGMRDMHGVVKFQLPFGLAMWCLHVLLLWWAISP
ncbi:MAG: DUF979 family protein [Polyangiales bacterium]